MNVVARKIDDDSNQGAYIARMPERKSQKMENDVDDVQTVVLEVRFSAIIRS